MLTNVPPDGCQLSLCFADPLPAQESAAPNPQSAKPLLLWVPDRPPRQTPAPAGPECHLPAAGVPALPLTLCLPASSLRPLLSPHSPSSLCLWLLSSGRNLPPFTCVPLHMGYCSSAAAFLCFLFHPWLRLSNLNLTGLSEGLLHVSNTCVLQIM